MAQWQKFMTKYAMGQELEYSLLLAPTVAKRLSAAQQRAIRAQRRRTLGRSGRMANLTLLESHAVKEPTEEAYLKAVTAFVAYASALLLDWKTTSQLDAVLVVYFTEMFLEGYNVEAGAYLLAGLNHFLPAVLDGAGQRVLPRCHRALKGWRKLAPPQMRLPMPRAAVLAIAGYLASTGRAPMAVWVALTFVCYLRPTECQALLGQHIIPPAPAAGAEYQCWGILINDRDLGIPGKTGILDGSVIIDMDDWLIPCLAALRASRPPGHRLWEFEMPMLRRAFEEAVAVLGLGHISQHIYSLRHGGASDDLLQRRRSIDMVQRRGGWKTATSLRRYAKETRLLAELQKVPAGTLEFGRAVQDNFATVVAHGAPAAGLTVPQAYVPPPRRSRVRKRPAAK